MVSHRVSRLAQNAAISISLVLLFAFGAWAQDSRHAVPGKFDFYVLALSWSPSYCAAERERGRNNDPQCSGRPFSFVVHGLWPQYERGYPSFCEVPAPRLARSIVDSMLDLMPSPRLVYHEWDRHGTCSGLKAGAYFDSVRKARAAVKIPADYRELAKPITVTPAQVTDAFMKANPGLTRAAMSIDCSSKRIREVWVCLGKDFAFRACPQVVQRSCKRDYVAMPAVRGE
jgi:ribonuclease T2